MRLLWLPDVLRSRGLVVVEVAGWQTRGVDLDPVTGVICHHTASAAGSGECPSLGIVVHGRPASGKNPALPGPLAQILLGRSGACYVVAAGKANHAGAGSYPTIPPNAGGNGHLVGIEAENSGVGEPWTSSQMLAYATLAAALAHELELDETRVVAHYEWRRPLGYKIDPAGPWLGGGDWYSGGRSPVNHSATAKDFRHRVRIILDSWSSDMTPDEHNLLVQAAADAAYSRHFLDSTFGIDAQGNALDMRLKLDRTYGEVRAEDHRDTLAGRVAAIDGTTNPATAPPPRK